MLVYASNFKFELTLRGPNSNQLALFMPGLEFMCFFKKIHVIHANSAQLDKIMDKRSDDFDLWGWCLADSSQELSLLYVLYLFSSDVTAY